MAGSHYKLIRVARVLVVVHHAAYESAKQVVALEEFGHISVQHEEVEGLQTVQYVRHAVVLVVFEVAHLQFARKVDQVVQLDVVLLDEAVLLENLEGEELQGVLDEDLLKVESVKLHCVDVVAGLLVQFVGKLSQFDFDEEIHLFCVDIELLQLRVLAHLVWTRLLLDGHLSALQLQVFRRLGSPANLLFLLQVL